MNYLHTQPMFAVEHAYSDGRQTYDIFPTKDAAVAYCNNTENWSETHIPLFLFKAANTEKTQQQQRFFDCLPPDFDRTIYIATAERLRIPPKTAERYINSWCKGNYPSLSHIAHGKYAKNTKGKAPS